MAVSPEDVIWAVVETKRRKLDNDDDAELKCRIAVSFRINTFTSISITSQNFVANFALQLRWFEPRLTYSDLKDDSALNKPTNVKHIWIPCTCVLPPVRKEIVTYQAYSVKLSSPLKNQSINFLMSKGGFYPGDVSPSR